MQFNGKELVSVLKAIRRSEGKHGWVWFNAPDESDLDQRIRVSGITYTAFLRAEGRCGISCFSVGLAELLDMLDTKAGDVSLETGEIGPSGHTSLTVKQGIFEATFTATVNIPTPLEEMQAVFAFDTDDWYTVWHIADKFTTKPEMRRGTPYYSRPVLGCLHIVKTGDSLKVEAADGYKLATFTPATEYTDSESDFLVEALPIITAIPVKSTVFLAENEHTVRFTWWQAGIQRQLEVPTTDGHIPDLSLVGNVDPQNYISLTESVLTPAEQHKNVNAVSFTSDSLIFSHSENRQHEVFASIPWDASSFETTECVSFNTKYLRDVFTLTGNAVMFGEKHNLAWEYKSPLLRVVLMPFLIEPAKLVKQEMKDAA